MANKQKFRIEFTKKAEKEFAKLDLQVRKYLLGKLTTLSSQADTLKKAVKIVHYQDVFRFRFGNYRVIFQLRPDGELVVLLILKVAHRKEVYEDV